MLCGMLIFCFISVASSILGLPTATSWHTPKLRTGLNPCKIKGSTMPSIASIQVMLIDCSHCIIPGLMFALHFERTSFLTVFIMLHSKGPEYSSPESCVDHTTFIVNCRHCLCFICELWYSRPFLLGPWHCFSTLSLSMPCWPLV